MSFKKTILSAALIMGSAMPVIAAKGGGTDAFGNVIGSTTGLRSKPITIIPKVNGSRAEINKVDMNDINSVEKNMYCLNQDLKKVGAPPASKLKNVNLKVKGESWTLQTGNTLIVSGKNVRQVLGKQVVSLPYIAGSVYAPGIDLLTSSDDICLSSLDLGYLDEIVVTYEIGQGPTPPPPPPTGPVFPPPPPPPPTPMEDIRGSVVTLLEDGQVAGWACDTRRSNSIQVVGYITVNGRTTRTREANADKYVGQNQYMGNPDFNCSRSSGFHETIPDFNRYAGSQVTVEVRGLSLINGREYTIGSRSLFIPLRIIPASAFKVSGPEIYHTKGDGNYCHLLTPNQVTLYNREIGFRGDEVAYNRIPSEMRYQGDCAIKAIPLSLFGVIQGDRKAIYFSDGFTMCHVPDMNMVARIKSRFGLRGQDTYPMTPNSAEMRGVDQMGNVVVCSGY